jgi:hypothetical protein
MPTKEASMFALKPRNFLINWRKRKNKNYPKYPYTYLRRNIFSRDYVLDDITQQILFSRKEENRPNEGITKKRVMGTKRNLTIVCLCLGYNGAWG